MSIRLRLTLWYSGVLAITLLLFGVIFYLFLSLTTNHQIKEALVDHADNVSDRINFRLSFSLQGWDLNIQLDEMDNLLSNGIYLQVVNLSNNTYSQSSNLRKNRLRIPFDKQQALNEFREGGDYFERGHIGSYPFLIYNKPIVVENELVGVLQSAVYIGSNEQFLSRLRFVLFLSSLGVIVLAATLGWFLARKALGPIELVIDAANQVQNGADLEKRIGYDGPQDEIGRLTETINGMLSRMHSTYLELEEAYSAQRRFVSDASHELRTPLTTIRGNVELLEKMWAKERDSEQRTMSTEALSDIADEAKRMSRLVNDLLSLARADAGFKMEKESLLLRPVVEEVIRKASLLPRSADWIAGDLSTLEQAEVYGNRDYLQQLLFIFIENAFKYTEHGRVSIEAARKDEMVGIRIKDSGIGMEKTQVPHIFERFYRADVSRGQTSGTGLGLSIAKWIIDEHQGSIEVSTRQGEGSTFVIWLPASFPPLVE